MDKITKFLLKLSTKDRDIILLVIEQIITGKWKELDYKKIVGYTHTYRVRKGNIRIVFSIEGSRTKIINIDYRGSIYKDL